MSSVNWHEWSLEDLKALVDDTHPQMLEAAIKHFNQAAQHLATAQDSFMSHMNGLGDAWQGKAATAAINNAQTTYQSMEDTRASSSTASTQTTAYKTDLTRKQQQAKAVPNVDTSWGHAASSGGWAGPVGIGVAKMQQQKKYDQHRDEAAKIVAQMDANGEQHASAMKDVSWPPTNSSAASPPASLPPVPGASSGRPGSSTSTPSGGYHSPGNSTGGPGYTPAVMGPAMNPNDHSAINGPKGPHISTGTTITQGGTTQTVDFPTVTQGGGAPGTAGTGPGGPVIASPPTTTTPGGAGAAAAVLGGAGLLGAGAAGSRGLLSGAGGRGVAGLAGEPEGRLGARGLGAKGGSGGLGEGEGAGLRGGARGATGLGEGEGGLRSGVRGVNGAPANEELGAGRNGMLRGAGAGGLAGEPVAAEAGRGGYPMGGAGGRRRNEDEEAPMPDYLVETDDVWGDGASAAPPVIGE